MEDERQRQIKELEAKRDCMLRHAPSAAAFHRWLWPFFFVFSLPLFLFWLFKYSLPRLSAISSAWPDWSRLLVDCIELIFVLGPTMLLGFVVAVSGIASWRLCTSPRPAPDDLWGHSDLVGYEDETPREIQARIDALRAQSKDETENH